MPAEHDWELLARCTICGFLRKWDSDATANVPPCKNQHPPAADRCTCTFVTHCAACRAAGRAHTRAFGSR
jgi:hypothetical protein